MKKKKLLIGVVVVIGLLIGINSYSQYQKEVFNFDNEKITYAKLDGQYSLVNGDNQVDLPQFSGYKDIYQGSNKDELFLVNELGFLKFVNGKKMEEIYPGIQVEEYVTTSKIVTPEYDEGSFTKDGVLYIYSIFMGGDGSNLKILNTKTNEIKEQTIEGEIKDSYYDETTNRIYYYINKYNFNDGIDELSETKVYSIDPDTLKSEFLYFVPVSDKPSADVNARTIVPSEDSYVCIDCSNNKRLETHKVDENGKSKLVSSSGIQGAEDYDSNDGVQDGPNILHGRGKYTYNYNMESKKLSTFDLELSEFKQPVKSKDGKVYYFKKGQLESIDEEGNIKQESSVELKGGQIKAFLLP